MQRFATLHFVVVWVATSFPSARATTADARELAGALENTTQSQKEKLSKLLLAMARILERRSLFLGWLVFPMLQSTRASHTDHPTSLNDAIRPQSVFRVLPSNFADF